MKSSLPAKAIDTARQIAHSYYGITAKIKPLAGQNDWNFYLKTDEKEFILKIQEIGTDRSVIEMQHQAMKHLAHQSLSLELPLPIPNLEGEDLIEWNGPEGIRLVRLLTWVPGRLMAKVIPHSPGLLQHVGKTVGMMVKGLSNFQHPSANYEYNWNPSRVAWTENYFHLMEAEEQRVLHSGLNLFNDLVIPQLPHLRKSILHFDANDYNILINNDLANPKVRGLIDFGDMLFSEVVNELAITIAYAAMDKKDPLGAAALVTKGFHEKCPLEEKELAVLFPLMVARLMLTVTFAAINKGKNPDNEYQSISEAPAWNLLHQLKTISPDLAHYRFRAACGLEPCPSNQAFQNWALVNKDIFKSVVPFDFHQNDFQQLDLSVGSEALGHNSNFDTESSFEKTMDRMLSGQTGVGGYAEVRPFYSTDSYLEELDNGPEWRTVHLGTDIWMPAGTAVFAPCDAVVHSVKDNKGERNYGPTVILRHEPEPELIFYTLYGHLERSVLDALQQGEELIAGTAFAKIGQAHENGNWPPHLHFQILLDTLNLDGDFPGATFYQQQDIWKSICPNPNLILNIPLAENNLTTSADLLQGRREKLGPSLSLSYSEPLHMERAYQQYLYDNTGRRYLDTVNNVPHVGHQHERVIKAATQQMALLNTNTRYLHKNILNFAEELLATFPPELCVVHFVNSGSEANELALRMAKTYSKQQDMIVLEAGYHGNTNACIEMSSYKFESKGGTGLSPRVEMATAPDVYRGPYKKEDPDAGEKYAKSIGQAIERVHAKGRGIAGFIHESILSCGGQLVLPKGYLKSAYAKVRKAGGLCIADEVQVGFGRVGDCFWGFQLQDVVPDIVTIGKPMGNGHPLGAVVCTREVAEAFNNGMEYFNTFGGNPVSCAVGLEVLRIVKEENLQQHALDLGNYLKAELNVLKSIYPIIGDVRGHGLFLGFELVRDPISLEPAAAACSYLANRMRQHGVLMSTDGPLHNVIKIKPPMCFTKANADFLLRTLDKVFGEDAMGR